MTRFPLTRPFLNALLAHLAASIALAAASFPTPFDTGKTTHPIMPPLQAAARIELPPGFHATLFAGEPEVRQPIAMTTDARGRLWVAENYTYSEQGVGWHATLRDRIVIFEDTNHNGRYDKRTIFWEGAQRLTSIEVGLGGVWALCLPELIFIPDRNGDDVPDSAPEVVLDGFEFEKAQHTVANGLRWGPDGWLYGRQGILAKSRIGAPGTPEARRTPTNVGIWRYHPQRRTFELFAEGTTNPWGMDWDAHGELFFINTVIGHLWQAIPGAHYRRMVGDDPNPHVYELIEQHADHVHWSTGEIWTDVRKGVTDSTLAAGGGHAHTGLLIYQGGAWPAGWNGKLLTINFHGRRFNVERLEREGSAFIGRREPDAFLFPDKSFRGLDLVAAPDGGVFVSDWNGDGECHDHDGVLRSTGRIFKINYGQPTLRPPGDLAQLDDLALVRLQRSDNDWLARQSRRVLADRVAAGVRVEAAQTEAQRMLVGPAQPVHRLRALWTLHLTAGLGDGQLAALLDDRDEHIRIWAIRLLTDDRASVPPTAIIERLVRLASTEPSALVRLALASALQRLPDEARAQLASPLLARGEDASDHNIPLMLWYGIEPLVRAQVPAFSFEVMLAHAKMPRVQKLGARRIAEDIDTAPDRVDALLTAIAEVDGLENRQAVLDGLAQSLSGRRNTPKPTHWDELLPRLARRANAALHTRIRDLSAMFGDPKALAEIRDFALNSTADIIERRLALEVLVATRGPGLREVCLQLIKTRRLASTAAAGLATFSDPMIAGVILAVWPELDPLERASILAALVSRLPWSAQVLDALEAGTLRKSDISVAQVRQMRAYQDPVLTPRLVRHWGPARDESEKDRTGLIAAWTARFAPEKLAGANVSHGRVVFRNLCGACHTLNSEGGTLGPDLTGGARDNLNYLLENILFPSALVPDDYRLTTLTLKDGRALVGMIRERSGSTLKLKTMTDLISLSRADVAKEETSAASLMPPGLLDSLSGEEARDLITYLMSKSALPK